MTHQKPLNTRRLLARLTASGFVLTILMSGSFFFTPGIRHAEAATADCSDVFTPLSSFVTDGVAANKTFYLQVMNATGVPWELLAAIHYRETNFSHSNPANGQGIFQFSGGVGGPYPPGAVSDTEFLRQLTYMANRIQTDYALRNSPNPASVTPRALVANEQDINLVKNTLYSYNGRATVYANQATQFGYNATTQPYEGSPYVMNRFDCARARMGIITQDFGTIDGTDTRYGTFTLFARLQSDAYWLSMTQPYAWVITSQTAYTDSDYTHALTGDPTLAPGQKAYFKVVARNIGYQTWSQSVVHLGTSAPRDRASSLSDGSWLSPQRIAMQESSVTTGNTATFAFSINTPTAPGTYVEYFNVVADGVTWLPDQDLHYAIDVVSPVSASNTQNLQLTAGQFITPSTFLMSADTQSTLRLLPNGNLTLYNDLAPAWSNSTSGAPASFVLQYDGNLVEYDSTGHPLWASGTSGSNNSLILQNDGNLVLYSQSGSVIWATNTVSLPDHLARVDKYLPTNGILFPGQSVQTASRAYSLVLQYDGNLVEYDSTGHPLWASGTSGSSNYLAMQRDGNLVEYDSTGHPLWASGTGGSGNMLYLQPDGTMILSSGGGGVLWSSRLLKPGQSIQTINRMYGLVLQRDGNLVEYDNAGHPLWASGTSGSSNYLAMQPDGNLVIYAGSGKPLWATATAASRSVLALQPDGNLVIYGPTGTALWAIGRH